MIRKATIQDLDQITKLELKCFPESEAASKENLEARIMTFSNSFWVLEVDNQIVSFINGMITNEKTINDEMFENVTLHNPNGDWQAIFGVDTLPEYQGKGYARALIEFIVNNYREQYAILQVGTGDSPLTIPFYEKCGFVRSHIISNFFTDNYDHPICESGIQLVDMVYLQRPL